MKNISFIFILLFCSFLIGSAYSENITGANIVNTDDDEPKIFFDEFTSLTITNSATLTRSWC